MTSSVLSALGQPTRSLEWLIGPDALLSSTALATGQLGTLGPIASLVEGGSDLPLTEAAISGLTGSATDIANQAVLDVHDAVENIGHEVLPLNGPLHALTALGETIGLGKIGEPGHLLTDLAAIPQSVAGGGGLASAAPALNDAGQVLGATDDLAGSVLSAATSGNPLAPDGLLGPVSNLANAAVLDIRADLDGLGHALPLLADPLQGLAGLDGVLGLGHLGTSGSLLTDVAGLPGALLGGQGLGALSPVLGDLGHLAVTGSGLFGNVLEVPGTLLGGLTDAGGGLLAPVTSLLGGEGNLGPNLLGHDGGLLQPVADVTNGVIDGFHTNLQNLAQGVPILVAPVEAIINVGGNLGLDGLGEGPTFLTDVIDLPESILNGNGAAGIGQVASDAGHVANAVGGVLGTVPGVVDGVLSGSGTPLDGVLGGVGGGSALAPVTSLLGGDGNLGPNLLGHDGGLLQPVADVTNGVIDEFHSELANLAHGVPILVEPVNALLNVGGNLGLDGLGEGPTFLTDVIDLPENVLNGNGAAGIGQVVSDAGHIANAAGGLLGTVPGVVDGALSGSGTPLDGVLGGVANGGPLSPVTSLLGGLGGGEEGSHPLVEASAGPTTSNPVANVGLLTPLADPSHTVQVGAIAVGPDQPSLLGASLLTGDSLPLPSTGGADSLVGRALDFVQHAGTGSGDVEASHGGSIDLGLVAIELGGHVDAHHADPTPHGATGGLHLLGL